MNKLACLLFVLTILIPSCIEPKAGYEFVAPGMWRGVLHLNPEPPLSLKDEIRRYEKDRTRPILNIEDQLPFFFEVKYEEGKKLPYIELINGPERLRIDEVYMGRNNTTAEDTIFIDFSIFDSHIKGVVREGIIEGEWVVRNKVNYRIPFTARFGLKDQFNILPVTPISNISGSWQCIFDLNNKPYDAVGEFAQQGSELNGTFRTETGDYRYLHGTVAGNKFYLSCFDGAHAFLFYGKFQGDSIFGSFISGKSKLEVWQGIKHPNPTLRADTSRNKPSGAPVVFSFPDTEGKIKSLRDYTGKIKILQIMGTWCPNCYDETKFLKSYLADHPGPAIDVIALAFERYKDTAQSIRAIKNYKIKMKVPYDILLASTTDRKKEAIAQIPFLDSILSFPTMIVLDQQNRIHTIHTGFDGPATSKYDTFKLEFDHMIKALLQKK